jgi:hypothetical protein
VCSNTRAIGKGHSSNGCDRLRAWLALATGLCRIWYGCGEIDFSVVVAGSGHKFDIVQDQTADGISNSAVNASNASFRSLYSPVN